MNPLRVDTRLEALAESYAAARGQLQAHPQFGEYATMTDVPEDLGRLVEAYQTAIQNLQREDIPVASIIPARVVPRNDTLENICGNLRDAYKLSVPGKNLHVDELMTERRTNEELRQLGFYTADGILYFMDGGKPKLAITRESDNLVLRHIDNAFAQLTGSGNYHPDLTEAERAIQSPTTEVFDLTKLNLGRYNEEFSYFEIATGQYTQLDAEQHRLAERVHGKGQDFKLNMEMLYGAGITTTKVYVLNPQYVQEQAKSGPIGRAAWLGRFNVSSVFCAFVRIIDVDFRLRGVRR